MPTSSNVLCGCGRFMKVIKNSVTVEERLETGEPYKLWDADRFECPECGQTVISNFGKAPFAEHWQPNYVTRRESYTPIYPGRCRTEEEEAARRVMRDYVEAPDGTVGPTDALLKRKLPVLAEPPDPTAIGHLWRLPDGQVRAWTGKGWHEIAPVGTLSE